LAGRKGGKDMANPLDHPLFDRVSHYINLINFLVLITTGWFIHSPYPGMPMNLIRNLHFIFMYSLLINGVVRFYYSFFGKHKDYKDFFLTKDDLKNMIPQVKYYLFLGEHPKNRKYNPLQICAYVVMPIMAVCMAITGAILYLPQTLGVYSSNVLGLGTIRLIHYFLMWGFIVIIAIHVYLVFTSALEEFWLMFFGKTGHTKGN